jgi:hypothetical protein
MPVDHIDPGYDGPLTIRLADQSLQLQGRLRGQFDPIDGRYHWYGRLEQSEELASLLTRTSAEVHVVTPGAEAVGTLGDADVWGRLRVAGSGRPPFELPDLDEDEDGAGMGSGARPDVSGRASD